MTVLQSLAIKLVMLAVTVGVLSWVLHVPDPAQTHHAIASPPPASSLQRPVVFPLDLNRARLEELTALPGIGETLAQRVVEYRNRRGGFRSVDELRKVRGIGKKRFEQLRPLVRTAAAHD